MGMPECLDRFEGSRQLVLDRSFAALISISATEEVEEIEALETMDAAAAVKEINMATMEEQMQELGKKFNNFDPLALPTKADLKEFGREVDARLAAAQGVVDVKVKVAADAATLTFAAQLEAMKGDFLRSDVIRAAKITEMEKEGKEALSLKRDASFINHPATQYALASVTLATAAVSTAVVISWLTSD